MIRPLILALAAIPAAAIAQADAPSGRLEILGIAPSACLIRAPQGPSANNATFETSGSGAARIRIVEFVNPVTAISRGASMELAVPVICNGPHRLSLRSASGAMRRLGPSGAGTDQFAESLSYQLGMIWGPQQVTGSSGDGAAIDVASGRAGQFSISISIPEGGRPLVAGTYEDEIIVELHPAN